MWRKALLAAAAVLCAAGCTTTVTGSAVPTAKASGSDGPAALVDTYFTDLNSAGTRGPDTQRQFLSRTQHPDYTSSLCDLGDLTLREQPAMSTLRPDPSWKPEGGSGKPRGTTYVIAVSVSILRNGASIGEQIGLERIVLLDGKAYGFAPCPTG